MKTLLVIDSFISNQERADVCLNLIKQLRTFFEGYEILLINKSKNDYGLEESVDYYFNYGKGFLVGYPPEDILNNKKYERPYVYFETSKFIFENWMPLVNVTDHVAGIYNTFVMSTRIAKMLGYEKVFKVEYDTKFDEDEIINIKEDVDLFQDYLFYGVRKEGVWAKKYQYLIDVHICGYSTKIFENFEIVKDDGEFWNLCEKIGYYGKWIEYIIPAVTEYTRKDVELNGLQYEVELSKMYFKSQFDLLNSPGEWTEKWKDIPKISRISNDNGLSEVEGEVVFFYYNQDYGDVQVHVKIFEEGNKVFDNVIDMGKNSWYYFNYKIKNQIEVESIILENGKEKHKSTKIVERNKIKELTTRLVFK